MTVLSTAVTLLSILKTVPNSASMLSIAVTAEYFDGSDCAK